MKIFNNWFYVNVNERFLYRLSISNFSSKLILKGGVSFTLWSKDPYRSSRNIDFEWYGELNEETINGALQQIMSQICNDGLRFDTEGLRPFDERFSAEVHLNEILRYFTYVYLGEMCLKFCIDIGSGEISNPPTHLSNFTTILPSNEIHIHTIDKETAIAEKFHAMCEHTEAPSRIKDLYDVWHLINQNDLDETAVANSMQKVFKNRNNTPLPTDIPTILTETFANNEGGKKLWSNFSKRVHGVMPEFAEIRSDLRVSLMHHANFARKLDN